MRRTLTTLFASVLAVAGALAASGSPVHAAPSSATAKGEPNALTFAKQPWERVTPRYAGTWSSTKNASADASPAFLQLQRLIERDRARGWYGNLRLGALSDGVFNLKLDLAAERITILMPALRAPRLDRTRKLVANRYPMASLATRENEEQSDAPSVHVTLDTYVPLKSIRGGDMSPRAGKPLRCPAEAPHRFGAGRGNALSKWNAKRIIGKRIELADAIARRHGCDVRAVWIDGMSQAVRMDMRPNRINVALRGKRVVAISRIG